MTFWVSVPIGLILAGMGFRTPLFWSGRTDPHVISTPRQKLPPRYKYTTSEILLVPPNFSDQRFASECAKLSCKNVPYLLVILCCLQIEVASESSHGDVCSTHDPVSTGCLTVDLYIPGMLYKICLIGYWL